MSDFGFCEDCHVCRPDICRPCAEKREQEIRHEQMEADCRAICPGYCGHEIEGLEPRMDEYGTYSHIFPASGHRVVCAADAIRKAANDCPMCKAGSQPVMIRGELSHRVGSGRTPCLANVRKAASK